MSAGIDQHHVNQWAKSHESLCAESVIYLTRMLKIQSSQCLKYEDMLLVSVIYGCLSLYLILIRVGTKTSNWST